MPHKPERHLRLVPKPETKRHPVRDHMRNARDKGGVALRHLTEFFEVTDIKTGNLSQMVNFNLELKELSKQSLEMQVRPGHTYELESEPQISFGRVEDEDTSSARILSAVIQAGVSTFGIVIDQDYTSDGATAKAVYLVQLPYGKFGVDKVASDLQEPARVLYSGNLDHIEQSVHEGYEQRFISRHDVPEDGSLARDCQFIFTVAGDGSIFLDAGRRTTEPTMVLTADIYSKMSDQLPKNNEIYAIVADLQANPQKWDPLGGNS